MEVGKIVQLSTDKAPFLARLFRNHRDYEKTLRAENKVLKALLVNKCTYFDYNTQRDICLHCGAESRSWEAFEHKEDCIINDFL